MSASVQRDHVDWGYHLYGTDYRFTIRRKHPFEPISRWPENVSLPTSMRPRTAKKEAVTPSSQCRVWVTPGIFASA
jgi:hypothetical protein